MSGIGRSFVKGTWLLGDIDLTVHSGEVLAVVGPSGCGKTTLLNLIGLVDTPDCGDVELYGRRVTEADVGRIPIGYIFQLPKLLPWSSVIENTLLGVRCRPDRFADTDRSYWEREARRMLERVGFHGDVRRRPAGLSGGESQRVALAQSLLIDPSLLLLDEPTASLDAQAKLMLERLLVDILRTPTADGAKRTAILVTHDIDQALALADRVVVIAKAPFEDGLATRIVHEIKLGPERPADPIAARHDPLLGAHFRAIWNALGVPST